MIDYSVCELKIVNILTKDSEGEYLLLTTEY